VQLGWTPLINAQRNPNDYLEHKLVADTMNGSEMHWRRGISFELLSQMDYLIVHRPKMLVFADVPLKFLARDDISAIPQQKLKESKITTSFRAGLGHHLARTQSRWQQAAGTLLSLWQSVRPNSRRNRIRSGLAIT
jgi:hypothetical protein